MAESTNVKKPNKFVNFFREIKAEIKKIVWPAPSKLAKDTTIVIVFVAVIGLAMGLFGWGIESLLALMAK